MKRFFKVIILSLLFTNATIAQDTLVGNYTSLNIAAGKHVIKDVVTVSGKLVIESGAKIEFIEPGALVCESGLEAIGRNYNIELFGKLKHEGTGIIIKNIDSSKVEISNVVFRNLVLPIFFDFGWKRTLVNISDNQFINNIGKISVVQVLNPPFNFNQSADFISFRLNHNLFTGNNAAIYFEDLKSDHLKIDITNNTFANNFIYGFKNYNISTNLIYGRADQLFSKFSAKFEGNSFVSNYLVDNLSDTIVHIANFGVYGTDKTFDVSNNYWGFANKENIYKGIYDQSLNYNSPKVVVDPFLTEPDRKAPAHIYAVKNGETEIDLADTLALKQNLKSLKLFSNNKVDISSLKLDYSYFNDDSSMKSVDTTLSYSVQSVSEVTNKILITKSVNLLQKLGYYHLSGIVDNSGNVIPDIRIGYIQYVKEIRRRKILADIIKEKKLEDSVKTPPRAIDSLKNTFQKIEAPLKSRIEVALYTGGAVFTGTISNKNIFQNEMNLYNALHINYTVYSNISAGLTIASFKLSNSDYASANNDQIARGISFSTSMLSISPSIQYDYVDNRLYSKARRIRPSIGMGLDISSFNPTGIYKGKTYNLQPLGTGGQLIDSGKKAYSLMALGYFINFKVKYQLSRFNSVGVHISYHKSMSDYLDDVGPDIYPSVKKILENTKTDAAAAVYFSNPTSRSVSIGQLRNSPNTASDSYINFGFFFSRRLFK